MYRELLEKIEESDMILIGVGEEASVLHPLNPGQKNIKEDWEEEIRQIEAIKRDKILSFYNSLEQIFEKKNYCVITTNVDGLIYESRINPVRIVAPSGNVFKLQCRCGGTEGIIDAPEGYYEKKQNCICPKCGKAYEPNVYNEEYYNEDGYLKQWNLYNKWLQGTLNKKLLVLEIGCDFSMLSIIRLPFEKIVMINQKAFYYRVNDRFPQVTAELKDRMKSIKAEPAEFAKELENIKNSREI